MATQYYAILANGESYLGATIHRRRDCPDANTRPVGKPSVDSHAADVTYCPDCTDRGTDTCEVVKADGEVCGRDRPCAYHD
jgi:hypothetical protein